jgi:processing peptidase subunit beta
MFSFHSFFRLAANLAADYSVQSYSFFNQFYRETGLFGIYYTCQDIHVESTMWSTLDQLVRLCHNITEKEVNQAKTTLKTEYLMERDCEAKIASDIGLQFLAQGRRMTTAEVFARIDALTVDDIKATANKFINDEDPAVAGVGAIFELPDYLWVRRRTFWSRY